MGYFDADAEEMLEVYLLEARQLTEQLNAVAISYTHLWNCKRKYCPN